MLEDLYYGNIEPANRLMKKGGEYEKITHQLVIEEEQLEAILTEEAKNLQKKIEEHIYALGNIAERESFIEGFRLGHQLAMEILHYKSANFYQA